MSPLALENETAPPLDAGAVLAWYDRHARVLPWRTAPADRAAGIAPDPYRVWLSEIMLQQTTVAAVAKYYRRFLELWPTVADLAAAPPNDVLVEWAGLGYYARARNLHACARAVVEQHGGRFPRTAAGFAELPGIGRYTSAAIAAIAFGRKATVMDGNVERVIARVHRVETPLPDAKPTLYALAEAATPDRRPGDYAQAMMDLGATICVPRKPRCMLCPLERICRARADGVAEALPARKAKAERPVRRAVVFWIRRADGAVLLRRRPESGLLGGLMEFPSTPWIEAGAVPTPEAAASQAPVVLADWRPLPGVVIHVFTHFRFEVATLAGAAADPSAPGLWVRPEDLADHALPTLMKKIARHAVAGGA